MNTNTLAQNPLVFDPTRTGSLRRSFNADMLRRMAALKRSLRQLIVEEDAFGLRPPQRLSLNTRFKFLTDDEKLNSFNRWFANEVKKGVLQVDHTGKPWTAKYVDSAYKKGRVRAFLDSHQQDYSKPEAWLAGSREQFLRSAFNQPETVSKLRLIGTRNFEQLKGITADMSSKLNRILASGIAAGRAPQVLARQISQEIDGITKRRAVVIARTELIHAHAEGALDSFEELGVKELKIMAEWSTAGDRRVCPRCSAMAGKVFTVKQARGLIPIHPMCRCAWVPVTGRTRPSKLGKKQIKALGGELPIEKPTIKKLPKEKPKDELKRLQQEIKKEHSIQLQLDTKPIQSVVIAKTVKQQLELVQERLPKALQGKTPIIVEVKPPKPKQTPKNYEYVIRQAIGKQVWEQRLTEEQKQVFHAKNDLHKQSRTVWRDAFALYTESDYKKGWLLPWVVRLLKKFLGGD